MAVQRNADWREISIHGVNALGICAFVSFMLRWPYFSDAGPPVDWLGLSTAMAADVLRLYVPVLGIDLLPRFFLPSRGGGPASLLLHPFLSALLFGLTAAAWFAGGATRPHFDWSPYLSGIAFFFALHFFAILMFEVVVRLLWLTFSASKKPRAG